MIWYILKIVDVLENLSSYCFVCQKPIISIQGLRMMVCNSQSCEFSFEENYIGSIFSEIKNRPIVAKFLLQSTIHCFQSARASGLAEPWPPFLLK